MAHDLRTADQVRAHARAIHHRIHGAPSAPIVDLAAIRARFEVIKAAKPEKPKRNCRPNPVQVDVPDPVAVDPRPLLARPAWILPHEIEAIWIPVNRMPTSADVRIKAALLLKRSNTTWRDITGPSRVHYHLDVRRNLAMMLRDAGLSWKRIGKIINRDHSTIINLVDGKRGRNRQ
jgi:hypothetical protein